jgi:hypothetical protein
MGELKRSESLLEDALTLRRAIHDVTGAGSTLNNLGLVAEAQGNYERARRLHEENVAVDRALGNMGGTATGLINLGNSLAQLGETRSGGSRL